MWTWNFSHIIPHQPKRDRNIDWRRGLRRNETASIKVGAWRVKEVVDMEISLLQLNSGVWLDRRKIKPHLKVEPTIRHGNSASFQPIALSTDRINQSLKRANCANYLWNPCKVRIQEHAISWCFLINRWLSRKIASLETVPKGVDNETLAHGQCGTWKKPLQLIEVIWTWVSWQTCWDDHDDHIEMG